MTGATWAEAMATDLSLIQRWLEYKDIEDQVRKAKQANAQPGQ